MIYLDLEKTKRVIRRLDDLKELISIQKNINGEYLKRARENWSNIQTKVNEINRNEETIPYIEELKNSSIKI